MSEAPGPKRSAEITTVLIEEINRLVAQERRRFGDSFAQRIEFELLARFVGLSAYRILTESAKAGQSNKAQLNTTVKAFAEFKLRTQNAISAAFQGAMTKFTGKPTEYYCNIMPVPESLNKMEC